jgi:hypothetical protein
MAGPALKSSLFPTHIPASSTTSPNLRCAAHRSAFEEWASAILSRRSPRAPAGPSCCIATPCRPTSSSQLLSSPPKRRSATCSFSKHPRLRGPSKVAITIARAHCRSALRFVLESCAAGGRMAIHLRTSSAGSREIMTTFGPASGLSRPMCRHKRPARITRSTGARSLTLKSKSRSNDCAVRKIIQYTFQCKAATLSAATYA